MVFKFLFVYKCRKSLIIDTIQFQDSKFKGDLCKVQYLQINFDFLYLRRSFSKISSIVFSWQKIKALCWDTTFPETPPEALVSFSLSLEAIPESVKSCFKADSLAACSILFKFSTFPPRQLSTTELKLGCSLKSM